MLTPESALAQRIGTSWEGKTPGFKLRVLLRGEVQVSLDVGVTYPLYDWASLTKMVLTTTLFMECVQEGLLHEDDKLSAYLPDLTQCDPGVQLRHILCHSAGLPGTIGFWPTGLAITDPSARNAEWRRRVLSLPMVVTGRSSYSEIDFQIIGYVLAAVLGPDIEGHWQRLSAAMGLKHTHFHPGNEPRLTRTLYAPTEDCPLRLKRIQGEVHHPDIWRAGGVGWLSGLFGPISDLVLWVQGLRNAYYGLAPWVIEAATLRRFTERVVAKGSSSLGFMMPKLGQRTGQAYYLSSGSHFGPNSIGHTGLPGPMFWFDPDRDLAVLVLANRTFPSAANESWFDYRGVLNDWVVQALADCGLA